MSKTLLRYMAVVLWKTGKNFVQEAEELRDPLGITEADMREIRAAARVLEEAHEHKQL